MRGFGWQELIVILAIVLVIFGAARLPQLGRALGEAIRNFRKGLSGQVEEERSAEKPKEQEQ